MNKKWQLYEINEEEVEKIENKYKINKTIMKNGLVKSKMLIRFFLPQESSKLIVIRA